MAEGVLRKEGKKVFGHSLYLSRTLILMGDRCSEENADTTTIEISARVKTLEALG